MSTLDNAMQVLKLIVRLRRDITVSDLATQLSMPKSSASRTLSEMGKYGFLERDPVTRAYRPGPVVMEASYHFRGTHSTLDLIEAQLDKLVRETGYTVYIDVLDGTDSLVIQMRTGVGALQVYTPPGTRLPAHSTSVGRAILARIPDEEVLRLLSGKIAQGTNVHVPQTPAQLLARLAEVRENGWSLSYGGSIDNVAGVSTSIMDPSMHQTYGLSIALPAQHLNDAKIERFSRIIVDVACDIGHQVGDPYWLAFKRKPG
jgi:DNA-binding IclR family transcriptional regulator